MIAVASPSPSARGVQSALLATAERLGLPFQEAWSAARNEIKGNLLRSAQRLHLVIRACGHALRLMRNYHPHATINFQIPGCMLAACVGISDRQGQTVRAQLRAQGHLDYRTHGQRIGNRHAIDGLSVAVAPLGVIPQVAPESYEEVTRSAFKRDRSEHLGAGQMLRELARSGGLGQDELSCQLLLIKVLQMIVEPDVAVLGLETQRCSEQMTSPLADEQRQEPLNLSSEESEFLDQSTLRSAATALLRQTRQLSKDAGQLAAQCGAALLKLSNVRPVSAERKASRAAVTWQELEAECRAQHPDWFSASGETEVAQL